MKRHNSLNGLHSEAMTKYDTSNLVQLNLADKQNVPYATLEGFYSPTTGNVVYNTQCMPAFASVSFVLTLPKDEGLGWKAGIRRIWQQLRTANSGRINYYPEDIEKYVINVRALCAIQATLARAYELSYTFRSTNSGFPEQLLLAAGFEPNTIIDNAANLFMYLQRFTQQIKLSFPLNIPLLHRTKELFGNVFLDSESKKPSFYVPRLSFGRDAEASNSLFYYISKSTSTPIEWTPTSVWGLENGKDFTMTYDQLIAQSTEIRDRLLATPVMATIAADIIKAFGDSAYMEYDIPSIDSAVNVIYDEDFLSQLQSANVVNIADAYVDANNQNDNTNCVYRQSIASDGWLTSSLVLRNPQAERTAPSEAYANRMLAKYNNPLINWHTDDIKSGEVLNLIRWVPSKLVRLGSDSNTSWEFGCYGTEVIARCYAVNRFVDESNNNIFTYVQDIAGTIYMEYNANANAPAVSGEAANDIGRVMMLWANFDWAPRMRLAGATINANPDDVGQFRGFSPDILDWDVFTELSVNLLDQYLSYGNQSLLYAGPSQNQSNRKVYLKGTDDQANSKVKRNKRSPKQDAK